MSWAYLIFLAGFYLLFRNKIEWIFPLFMLKSKKFTREIHEFGSKNQWILRGFFSIGVLVGLMLLIYSFVYLVEGVIKIKQEEVARLSMVLPDQEVGGITFPLAHWIIAISLTLIVHEFGHAVASAAEKIKPTSVAFVMFLGLIPGAGVEIDYEKLSKKPLMSRLRVMSAGTFMNILLALIIILVNIPLIHLGQYYLNFEGVLVTSIDAGTPAENVLDAGVIITSVNDLKLTSLDDIQKISENIQPNSKVFIETNKGLYVVKTNKEGRIGFTGVPQVTQKEGIVPNTLFWFTELMGWTFLVCIGVGVANMMPLWPFDGGLVIKEIVDKINLAKILVPIYALTLILVLINFFSPQIRSFIL